jgi:hypothetical protein
MIRCGKHYTIRDDNTLSHSHTGTAVQNIDLDRAQQTNVRQFTNVYQAITQRKLI